VSVIQASIAIYLALGAGPDHTQTTIGQAAVSLAAAKEIMAQEILAPKIMVYDAVAQGGTGFCGWVGVTVSPMTPAFAQSLGMTQPYGAIFDTPEPGSPAAAENKIEQGDVLLAINGTPLARASDFAAIISMIAPGDEVHFDMVRNGDAVQRKMVVKAVRCRAKG
jgi:PDZ domain